MEAPLSSWIDEKYKDLLNPQLEEGEKTVFFDALPVEVQNDVLEHQTVCTHYNEILATYEQELQVFLAVFFGEENESILVRPLAVLYGYIPVDSPDLMNTNVADLPVYINGRASADFKFLQPYEVGSPYTKYQVLFRPIQRPGATDFRKDFFHASNDQEGLLRQNLVVDSLRILSDNHIISEDIRAFLKRGSVTLQFYYGHRRNFPAQPVSLSKETGWDALRTALLSPAYWLTQEELQRLAACLGCRVRVVTSHGEGECEVNNPGVYHDMPGLLTEATVALRLQGVHSTRGHFSRLLSQEEIQTLQTRLRTDGATTGSDGDSERKSSDSVSSKSTQETYTSDDDMDLDLQLGDAFHFCFVLFFHDFLK
jgi:hypothetical protein